MSGVRRVNRDPREPHIEVPLARTVSSLTLAEATQLRDELTRALGAPQALTDREAMVWAAEFVRALQEGYGLSSCARIAARAVVELRNAARVCPDELTLDERAMLAAMTGGGR